MRVAERASGQAGSALLLMPAAVLIVLVLGALAVDRAVAFGAQRELVVTAQAAANDAVALGIDVDGVRTGEPPTLDPALVDRAVAASVAAGVAVGDEPISVAWSIDRGTIEVRLEQRVELVFAPGVPGAGEYVVVRASARAELRRTR